TEVRRRQQLFAWECPAFQALRGNHSKPAACPPSWVIATTHARTVGETGTPDHPINRQNRNKGLSLIAAVVPVSAIVTRPLPSGASRGRESPECVTLVGRAIPPGANAPGSPPEPYFATSPSSFSSAPLIGCLG